MRYLGSFVLQDMLLSLHIFAFDGQNLKFSESKLAFYIHLIPKWPPFKYSFVFLQISPYRLALKLEIPKNIFP